MTLRHTSRPCHIQVLRSTLITVFFHPPAGLLSSRPGCPSSCSAESSPPSSSHLTYSSAASSRTSCLRLFGYTLYTVIDVSGAFWWNICLCTNWVTASSSVVMHFLRVLKGKAKCFVFFWGGAVEMNNLSFSYWYFDYFSLVIMLARQATVSAFVFLLYLPLLILSWRRRRPD